jgi:hypothetical protein
MTPTSTATNTATDTSGALNTSTNTPTHTATHTPVNTATNTATNTPINTSTPTATVTKTPTLTSTPANNTTYRGPYPNPVSNGPVQIDVAMPGSGTIEMDVFTTAMRKIAEHATVVNGAGGTVTSVQWDLRDKTGMPIANGLYYLRLQVSGAQASTKIFKVIVVR